MAKKRALEGMKVLEFCSRIGGSYCTKLMADMGAETVKIEPPKTGSDSRKRGPFQGDVPHAEKSGHFLYLNSNKFGITLDPWKSTGKEIFIELAKRTDVLVEDNPPGELEKLGLGYDDLKGINPGLIMTSITPFGRSGPYQSHKAGYLNTSHVSGQGFLHPIPAYDDKRPPVMPGGNKGGYDAGITAVTAILAAYYWKGVSGKGQFIEISRQEALLTMQRVESANFPNTGINMDRSISKHKNFIGGVMRCKDGYINILAPQNHQWESILKMLGSPQWATKEFCGDINARAVNAVKINEFIGEWMKDRTREEIVKKGQSLSVPVAPVNSAGDIVESEQFNARGFFTELEHPEAGKMKFPSAPYRFSRTPWTLERPAPRLGEHNEAIYCGRLGYEKKDLVKLRGADVI